MTPKNTKTPAANVAADQNLETEIRHRAYALYEDRGREDGHDLDDWLRAEMEITTAARRAAA